MRILIMGFTKIKYMPYLNLYFDNIDKSNEVHILYWNRDLKGEDLTKYANVHFHEFCYRLSDEDHYGKKVFAFIKYRQYAVKVINEGEYDFIIVLHSLPAVLLYKTLIGRYKEKFILDYRDSTYEHFSVFQKLLNRIVEASKVTCISSDGFRKYMPASHLNKVYTTHNLLEDSLLHREDRDYNLHRSEKIRIAFWGFIRHKDINFQIIKQFGSDQRFELHYYGRELDTALALKNFVSDNGYVNIYFHGEYKPEDRYQFILDTDMIHNIYFDQNMMLAMGNKYYDGVIFRLPQLCMKGSFMGKKCTEKGIGFECDPYDENFVSEIYQYYMNLDRNAFACNCDKECEKIIIEYRNVAELIYSLR